MQVEPARTEAIVDSARAWERPPLRLVRLWCGEEQRATLVRARRGNERMFFFVQGDVRACYGSIGELIGEGWRVDADGQ